MSCVSQAVQHLKLRWDFGMNLALCGRYWKDWNADPEDLTQACIGNAGAAEEQDSRWRLLGWFEIMSTNQPSNLVAQTQSECSDNHRDVRFYFPDLRV
jgi:hypothetical protein